MFLIAKFIVVSKADSFQSFLNEAKPRLGFLVDILSFDRNSWLFLAGGLVGRGFNALATVSGVLMTTSAALLAKRAFETMARAVEENDPKTFLLHTFTSLPSAVSYATVGMGMTISNIAALAGKVGIAKAASSVIPGAAMAMSTANLASGLYGEYTTGKLKGALDEILDPSHKHEVIDASQRRKAAIKMVLARIQSDPREFERQTSSDCLLKVQELMEGKLVGTLTPELEKQILRLVYEANYRANLKGRFLIAVSIIGLIACITAMVLTGGVGTALIFAIGSLVWMALDSPEISKRIGDWFWAHRKAAILPKDLQDKADASPDSEVEFFGKNALGALLAPVWMIPSLIYFEGKVIYEIATAIKEDDDDGWDALFDAPFIDGKLPDIS